MSILAKLALVIDGLGVLHDRLHRLPGVHRLPRIRP